MESKRAQVGRLFIILIILAIILYFLITGGIKIESNKQTKSNEELTINTIDNQDLKLIDIQDAIIKSEVQTAISMVNNYYKKYNKREMSFEEAKLKAADALRNLRYGENYNGYFWADTSDGINVVLYGKKDVEGKNRYNASMYGVYYIQEIISNGMKPGGGYTEYYFPKYKQSEPKPKRSYSKYYEPFDWIIGTGYYLEDLKNNNQQLQTSD